MTTMFDAFKNLGNLGQMMTRAKEMQEKMMALQEELSKREFVGDASPGGVTAAVNGRLEMIRLSIDKTRIDPTNTELLEHLIVTAVANAQQKAAETMKAEMTRLASEMGVPPGMLPQ